MAPYDSSAEPEDINAVDPRPVRPPLNRHIDFFDTDGDGVVWPTDTVDGLHRLGFSWAFAIFIGFIGHIGFGPLTVKHPSTSEITGIWSFMIFAPRLMWSYLPDPFLRIYSRNLQLAKHTASTQSWNKDGWFDEEAFERIWAHSGSPDKDSLTYDEAIAMIKSYRHGLSDGTGLFKGPFEWTLLFWVVNPPDGRVTKDQVRSVYAGTIFDEVVKLHARQKADGTAKGSW